MENDTLDCREHSVSLKDVNYAEIVLFREFGDIKKVTVLLKKKSLIVPFKDEIKEEDIVFLEDYFIKNGVNYFIINRN